MKIVKAMLLIPLLGLSADGSSRGCSDGPTETALQRFRAVGFGTSAESWATEGQNQLLAIRTAKLDAYRTMAEQVYGFRITGSTTVSAMTVKSDRLRVEVDALIRGAKVVSVQPIAEDVYEVTLEMALELPIDDVEQCVQQRQVEQRHEQQLVEQGIPPFISDLFGLFKG
ncbi:MAG: hypothetical protein HOL04_10240 [Gammaproteobacteria bacterium]|jgi:hypothetical protein|nr:hypothetical protein [Gammaproteobacteria bacterium]MBT3471926.1 hypothetical protein [Gammaproteobacteria bacterium]MBT5362107.1 hypothetical protein [Gammaproteobacteria bacterium]